MAATGVFADAINKVVTTITALGLKPVTDPRNLRPLCVEVELPTFTNFTNHVSDITMIIRVLAPPPGNQDAADYLLTTVDTLVNSELAIISGQPTLRLVGSQELPSYDLTVRIGSHRT
jgi:hypothetical protein